MCPESNGLLIDGRKEPVSIVSHGAITKIASRVVFSDIKDNQDKEAKKQDEHLSSGSHGHIGIYIPKIGV